MKREDLTELVKKKNAKNSLLIFPTGYGKSKCAIEIVKQNNCKNILIVIPKLVLISNWETELKKWGYVDKVSFTTYVSIHKQEGKTYDAVIWDEAHHITDRVADYVPTINTNFSILLSATIKREKLFLLKDIFENLFVAKSSLKEAIEEEVLPEPKVILIPLKLGSYRDTIVIRKTAIKVVKGEYSQLNKLKNLYPKHRIEVSCNQLQKNLYYMKEIDYWKRRFFSLQNPYMKNNWLRIAGERLKWLATIKTSAVKDILDKLKENRVITFCCSIEQTVELGSNNINSKNKESIEILDRFNKCKINHITCVEQLNEGVNLNSCQIGLFAALNSSELLQTQKIGRCLRHPNPILIIPYYVGTREEEIVTKMFENQQVSIVPFNTFIDNYNL